MANFIRKPKGQNYESNVAEAGAVTVVKPGKAAAPTATRPGKAATNPEIERDGSAIGAAIRWLVTNPTATGRDHTPTRTVNGDEAPWITRALVGAGAMGFALLGALMTNQFVRFDKMVELNYAVPLAVTLGELTLWHFLKSGPNFLKLLLIALECFDVYFNFAGFKAAQGAPAIFNYKLLVDWFLAILAAWIAVVPELGLRFMWHGKVK
jgi:hypothetical protein